MGILPKCKDKRGRDVMKLFTHAADVLRRDVFLLMLQMQVQYTPCLRSVLGHVLIEIPDSRTAENNEL